MKIFFIVLFYLLSFNLSAQTLFERQIVPFDGIDFDYFGSAIAAGDSFLFISSPRRNSVSGEVYVYKKIDENFEYANQIIPSDSRAQDFFGTKMIYDGHELIIGAYNKRTNNLMSGPGAVFIFKLDGGIWVEKQMILPPEPYTYGGAFSSSIVKNGKFLLIGAERWNSVVQSSGMAFIYENFNGNYELIHELQPPDALKYQQFGSSLFFNDSIIVVGSKNDSTLSGIFSGSIYVYSKSDSNWNFTKKHIPESNSNFLSFGTSMSHNNENIFVGTSTNLDYSFPGSVYVFNYSSQSLELDQIIVSGDYYSNDRFGTSIYAKGDSLLIGALLDTVKAYNPGAAYLFKNTNGNWIRSKKFSSSDYTEAKYFGYNCLITDDHFIFGAPESKNNNVFTGKVYLYSDNLSSILDNFNQQLSTFNIEQNFPNPFNPRTKILYSIKEEGLVTLKVYDVLGKEIATLINENRPAGNYEAEFNASQLPSGVYIYKIQSGQFSDAKKMLLTK